MANLGDLSCLSIPLKCLLFMLLIIEIMAIPVLIIFPAGWIADGVMLAVTVIGLMATTGGNLLKIFEK